jgi:hypothetical protein
LSPPARSVGSQARLSKPIDGGRQSSFTSRGFTGVS